MVGTVRISYLDTSSFRGGAEVNVNGEWGAMCNRHYTDHEASVVCRELQCEGGVILVMSMPWHSLYSLLCIGRKVKWPRNVAGSVRMTLHSFNCTGLEGRVKDCSYSGADLLGCHYNEVDTACIPGTYSDHSSCPWAK